MTAGGAVSPARRLGSGVCLGVLLGASHAVAECAMLWWYGVALVPLDVALLLSGYAAASAAAGAAAGLVLSLVPSVRRQSALAQRRWLLLLLSVGYLAVGWRYHQDSLRSAPALTFPLMMAGFLIGLVWLRAAASAAGLLLGGLALASFQSVVGWLVAEIHALAPDQAFVAAAQALFPVVVLLLLVMLVRDRRGGGPAAGLAALGAVCLGGLQVGAWTAWPPPAGSLHVLRDATRSGAADRTQPDVFLIVLDTVRADHLELFGYERTTMPLLTERVRKDFPVAAAMMATSPSSLPSHASMFTGLYSHRHAGHKPFLDDPDPPPYAYFMRADIPTLAGSLSAAGFHSLGISANYGVLSSYGLGRGFTEYDVAPGIADRVARLVWMKSVRLASRNASGLVRRLLSRDVERRSRVFSRNEAPYRRADEVTDRALSWLERHVDEPAFVFLNYFDAHDPYLPVAEFDETFVRRPEGVHWVGFPEEANRKIERGEGGLTEPELAYLRGQYDAELRYLDQQLDRLFAGLQRLQRYEHSLFVIVGDHGEEFLEHGNLRHSTSLFGPQVDVPLLVKLPAGWPAPPPTASRMQFVDLYPTVLHLLGLPIDTELQGSLFAEGRDHDLAEVFCHRPQVARLRHEQVAVRIGPLKYVQWVSDTRPEGWVEVYDLAADPGETAPLKAPPADFVARAEAIIAERKAAMFIPEDRGQKDNQRLLDILGELGYVDGAPDR